MTATVLELAKVLAYGGAGILIGYLLGVRANDQHRLTTEVLNEAEADVPDKRRILKGDVLLRLCVFVAMVAMLLTGVAWMQKDQRDAQQDMRDCRRASDTAETLRERTQNYLEKGHADLVWKLQLRDAMVKLGAEPSSPFLRATSESIAKDRDYIAHLRENPYPKAKDC